MLFKNPRETRENTSHDLILRTDGQADTHTTDKREGFHVSEIKSFFKWYTKMQILKIIKNLYGTKGIEAWDQGMNIV